MGLISFLRNLFGGKKAEPVKIATKIVEEPKVKKVEVVGQIIDTVTIETKVEKPVTNKEIKSKTTEEATEVKSEKPRRRYNSRKKTNSNEVSQKPVEKKAESGDVKPKTKRRKPTKKKED